MDNHRLPTTIKWGSGNEVTAPTKYKMITIITTIIGIIIGGLIIYKYNSKQINLLNEEIKRYKYGVKSAYVKFGKTFEHFAPFTKQFNKENAKFLGEPIDYICFDEDKIRFIEVKTGNSQLSHKQNKIKKMIENKQIEFKEVRY